MKHGAYLQGGKSDFTFFWLFCSLKQDMQHRFNKSCIYFNHSLPIGWLHASVSSTVVVTSPSVCWGVVPEHEQEIGVGLEIVPLKTNRKVIFQLLGAAAPLSLVGHSALGSRINRTEYLILLCLVRKAKWEKKSCSGVATSYF